LEPGKSMFNLLSASNISTSVQKITVSLSVPGGWSLLCDKEYQIELQPGEKVDFPIRVAANEKVKGGIAHVMTASAFNENNIQLASAFCYIRTTEVRKLKIDVSEKFRYMKMQSKNNQVKIRIQNRGNAAEVISFAFETTQPLVIDNAEEETKHSLSIQVEPFTDTTISINIIDAVKEGDPMMSRLPRLQIEATTNDTAYSCYVWFKRLTSIYKPDYRTTSFPLTVGLIFRNLIGENNPSAELNLTGTVLLKKNRMVNYLYSINTSPNYSAEQMLWTYSQMWAHFQQKDLSVTLGDVAFGLETPVFGRGITAEYRLKRHLMSAHISRDVHSPVTNAGIGGEVQILDYGRFLGGGVYIIDDYNKRKQAAGYAGVMVPLTNQSFTLLFGFSNEARSLDSTYSLNGNGITGIYNGKFFNKLDVTFTGYYGSRDYIARSQGQIYIRTRAIYEINRKMNLQLSYFKHHISKPLWFVDSLLPENYSHIDQIYLRYGLNINPRVQVFAQPSLMNEETNSFYNPLDSAQFSTSTAKAQFGCRVITANRKYSLLTTFAQGYSYITDYGTTIQGEVIEGLKNIPAIPSSEFGFSVRSIMWGIAFRYYYGPYSLYQRKNFFYYGQSSRSFRITPYLQKYLYKDKVLLDLRANYDNYYPSKTERFSFYATLDADLDQGWLVRVYGSSYLNSRFNQQDESFSKYKSFYLQAGISKSFGIQQPRHKYFNLILIFYKDFDGSNKMDENEPGLADILVYLERQQSIDSLTPRETIEAFPVTELLSDLYGKVTYIRVPEGNYKVKYKYLGKNTEEYFDLSGNERNITVDRNLKVYVPFGINYKVFGSIMMNRDPNSNAGNIDLGNIKVTATSADGKNYSTLTEKDGSFMLFVPAAGTYKVQINNIFWEKFDLLQNDYIINFDGFKQFRVMFEFNEKIRKINFGND
ncbi:MAG: hypothetical protein KKA07_16150, partial [Bacteroidetes bacterium]|nr:hypothetical protein [Bacteroidota bacterium]